MTLKFRIHIMAFLMTTIGSCQKKETNNFVTIGSLSNDLKEISGITVLPNDPNIYAINDSGNENTLFKINPEGKIIATYILQNTTNVDWEDITSNKKGDIYIGDFGNNDNDRKDLAIYKVTGINNPTIETSKISFTLEDQDKFPPKKKNRNYDIEAFVYENGNFYLFTKNRSSEFDGTTKIYKLKDQSGTQVATLIHTLTLCDDPDDCFVTGAAINSIGNKIVLLTYNKIFVVTDFTNKDAFNGKLTKIKLSHFSQKEGITFKNDSTLYIVDEKRKKKEGRLYEYRFK